MTSLCDFHTQVLGCSHKGDRRAMKEMGLVTVCSRTWVVQLRYVYHVWRKKVNKWHKVRGERERQSTVLRWHFNQWKRQRGMEGVMQTRREDIFLSLWTHGHSMCAHTYLCLHVISMSKHRWLFCWCLIKISYKPLQSKSVIDCSLCVS